MIVCLHNNKTTQQKIAEIKIVNLPSSYNKYLQYLYDLPISTSIWKKREPLDDDDCQHVTWVERTDCLTRHHVHSALDMDSLRNKKREIPIMKGNNVGIIVSVSKSNIIIEIIFVLTRISSK